MVDDDPTARTGPVPVQKAGREALTIDAVTAPAPADETPPAKSPPHRSNFWRLAGALAVAACILASVVAWRNAQSLAERQTTLEDALGSIGARVDAAEKDAAGVARAPEQLAALAKRLDAVESRPVPQSGPGDFVAAQERRISAIEAANKATSGSAAAAALEGRLAALEASAAKTPAGVAPPVDLAPVVNRLDALETRLNALEAMLATTKSEVRATEAPLESAVRESDAASLAVVAQAIAGAVASGKGFSMELAAAEKLGADPAKLAPLAAVARDGAPTSRQLAQSFRSVSATVVAAAAPQSGNSAGLLERLTAAASRLVRTRPTGEIKGDDASALVTQIEGALDRGAVPAAITAWEKLPAPSRQASQPWVADARRRVAAETASKTILADAIAQVAGKRGPQ